MSGDQWFSLLKTALIMAFCLVVLYGVYKMVSKD